MIQLLDPRNTRRYLPNRKVLTDFYRPGEEQLPPATLKTTVFDFPNVPTLDVQESSLPIFSDQYVWAITGAFVNAADPNAGFQFMLTHTTDGKTRQLFNRFLLSVNGVGSAQLPFLLRQSYPVRVGDSLACQVKSLSSNAAASQIQVVLWMGDLAP